MKQIILIAVVNRCSNWSVIFSISVVNVGVYCMSFEMKCIFLNAIYYNGICHFLFVCDTINIEAECDF